MVEYLRSTLARLGGRGAVSDAALGVVSELSTGAPHAMQ
jgi:hypothetical protein